MAITKITTTLSDAQFGVNTPSDGIAMIFAFATAQSATSGGLSFELNKAYMGNSVNDFTTLGLTDAINPDLMFNIREFYDKAGNGATLWVCGIDVTPAGGLEDWITDLFPAIIQSTSKNNFDNRPRMLGWIWRLNDLGQPTAGKMLNKNITDTLPVLGTALDSMFADSYRMLMVVDGGLLNCAADTGMVTEPIQTSLEDLSSLNLPRIAIDITTTTPGRGASVGQVLGIMTSRAISSSIGDMSFPAVSQVQYFVDGKGQTYTNTPVTDISTAKMDILGKYQYIFTRPRPQRSGVYYNDGATCNSANMALSTLEFVRVGNVICDSVENYFVGLLNTRIPTTASGEVDPGFKASTTDYIYSTYIAPRINNQEVGDVEIDFWAKDGNLLTSRALEVNVRIFPIPTLKEVYIDVTFTTSLS